MSSITSSQPRLSRGDNYRQGNINNIQLMQCTSEWMIWHIKVLNWPNAISSQSNWSGTQTRSNSNSKCHFISCPNHKLSYSVSLTCSNMHDHGINRFFIFFWSFFIYNLFHLELRFNFYDFLKFKSFSGISWIVLKQKLITASAWHRHDVSRSTGLTQVKPDAWDPIVSVLGLVRVTDMWAQSGATSARSTLMHGAMVII